MIKRFSWGASKYVHLRFLKGYKGSPYVTRENIAQWHRSGRYTTSMFSRESGGTYIRHILRYLPPVLGHTNVSCGVSHLEFLTFGSLLYESNTSFMSHSLG